ncbi:MAG: hypothetical protein Q9217_001325 [Psora testacea]
MAAAIPPALRAADIARFAHRAGQVEKARPAVAYWCPGNYWIVDQIIAKGLHQADDDSKSYTIRLMDKLEKAKQDFASNDAIVDDMAGHAYIEQFGQETFQRAENTMKANKVSRQTADTFQAAATFMELCQIWGPLDAEIASKIKFAKYHALRIAKAIKAGEDPNRSNPTPEPSPSLEQPPLDIHDPDVQMLNGFAAQNRQPSVEGIPGDQVQPEPTQPQAPSPQVENYYHDAPSLGPEVSPLAPSSTDRKTSADGGYFPPVSGDTANPTHNDPPITLPDASALPPPSSESAFLSRSIPSSAASHSFPPPSMDQSKMSSVTPSATSHRFQPPIETPTRQAIPPPVPAQTHQKASLGNINQLRTDEVSVLAAQKHAKFAISALNFEDVRTAVKELREALEVLGAS